MGEDVPQQATAASLDGGPSCGDDLQEPPETDYSSRSRKHSNSHMESKPRKQSQLVTSAKSSINAPGSRSFSQDLAGSEGSNSREALRSGTSVRATSPGSSQQGCSLQPESGRRFRSDYGQHIAKNRISARKTIAPGLDAYGGPDTRRWISHTLQIDYEAREAVYADVMQNVIFPGSVGPRIPHDELVSPEFGRVVCLDFRDSISCVDHIGVDVADTMRLSWEDMKRTLRGTPASDTYLRLIIAEDLSDDVVQLLGSLFWLPSSMFNEHLRDMTSSPSVSVPARPPSGRVSSMTWFRPVWRSGALLTDAKERATLVAEGSTSSRETRVSPRGRIRKERGQKVSKTTRIFRSERALSIGHESGLVRQQGGKAAGWEERMTAYVTKREHCNIVILLTDPLPIIRRKMRIKTIQNAPRSTESIVPDDTSVASSVKVENILLYQQQIARTGGFPPDDFTTLVEESTPLNSPPTTSSMLESMLNWSTMPSVHLTRPDPLYALLEMLQVDLVQFVNNIGSTLLEIERESMVEHRLQESLQEWRRFIKESRVDLPRIRQSLQDYVHVLYFENFYSERTKNHDKHKLPREVDRLITDLMSQLQEMSDRCERTESALRTEISLLDSRRSIAEAESVSKLTELAFIFIPLTFAASLFSIQIEQLQGGAPLSSFVVTCVITLSLAYGARLSVRSNALLNLKRTSMQDARSYAGIDPSKKLSTTQFIIWVLHLIPLAIHKAYRFTSSLTANTTKSLFTSQVLVALIVISSLMVPAIILWLSSAFSGVKGLYSAVYVTTMLLFAGMCIRISMRWEDGRLWWREELFRNSTRAEWRRQREADEDDGFWDDDEEYIEMWRIG